MRPGVLRVFGLREDPRTRREDEDGGDRGTSRGVGNQSLADYPIPVAA